VTSYVLLRRLMVNNERGPLICTLAAAPQTPLNYFLIGAVAEPHYTYHYYCFVYCH